MEDDGSIMHLCSKEEPFEEFLDAIENIKECSLSLAHCHERGEELRKIFGRQLVL